MGDTTEGSRVEDMVGITYQVRHKFIVLAFKKLNTFETMNVFMGVNQLYRVSIKFLNHLFLYYLHSPWEHINLLTFSKLITAPFLAKNGAIK
jgi:hypothetical protein